MNRRAIPVIFSIPYAAHVERAIERLFCGAAQELPSATVIVQAVRFQYKDRINISSAFVVELIGPANPPFQRRFFARRHF
jgi:hypothetical protein